QLSPHSCVSSLRWVAEREQYVACHAAIARVAGGHVKHPARNDGSGPMKRTAAARRGFDSRELPRGVEIPKQLPVCGRERSEMTVDRAREHRARNRGDRRRLRGTAYGLRRGERRRR